MAEIEALTAVVDLGIVVEELLGGHVVAAKHHIVSGVPFVVRHACVSGNAMYVKTAFHSGQGRARDGGGISGY